MVVIIYTPLINEDWSRVVLEDYQKAYTVNYKLKLQGTQNVFMLLYT